jgi:hypothetical protein
VKIWFQAFAFRWVNLHRYAAVQRIAMQLMKYETTNGDTSDLSAMVGLYIKLNPVLTHSA